MSFGFSFNYDKNVDVFKSVIYDILIFVFAFLYKIGPLRYEYLS